MIIKGISLQGIFKYKSNIEYEINDMIIYNDILYIVTDSFFGDVTPDKSPQCKPYTEYHSYNIDEPSEDEETDNRIITASGLRSIINTMFRGLSLEGVISTLDTSIIFLDNYLDTGAYLLDINNLLINPFNLIPSGSRVLFRVYKSDTLTIQEIIDYNQPIIYYRYFTDDWSEWTFISNNDNNVINQVNAALREYQNKVLEYANKIEQIEDRSRIYLQEIYSSNIPQQRINITNVPEGSILQIGVMTDWKVNPNINDASPLQEWVTIDLSITNSGATHGSNNSIIYFKVNNTEDELSNIDLEMTPLADNAGIFKVLTSGKY